jgi:hypothetical protein
MACQEMTEARLECKEPVSVDMTPEVAHEQGVRPFYSWLNSPCYLLTKRCTRVGSTPVSCSRHLEFKSQSGD